MRPLNAADIHVIRGEARSSRNAGVDEALSSPRRLLVPSRSWQRGVFMGLLYERASIRSRKSALRVRMIQCAVSVWARTRTYTRDARRTATVRTRKTSPRGSPRV